MTRTTRPDSDLIPFGRWLLDRLDERHMRRADLARAAGVTSGVVSSWCYDAPPSPPSCEKVAAALLLPIDAVLTAAGHRPAEETPESEARREATALLARIPEPLLLPLIPMLRALAEQRHDLTRKIEEALDRSDTPT